MFGRLYVIALFVCASCAYIMVQDKFSPHIIKTRSIDLNNAHGLAMENQLERNIIPTGYTVLLEPNFSTGEYQGRVFINLTWNADTEDIVLHCAPEVEVTMADLLMECINAGGVSTILLKRLERDTKRSTIKILFEEKIAARNKGVIKLGFKGRMALGSSEGLFKSTYNTEKEGERMVAATQFRPNNARRVFPCFDEPEFKVAFQVKVICPRDMVALSNMPVEKTEDIPNKLNSVLVYFEKTPIMSTFTLGIVMGHITMIQSINYSDRTHNDFELRLWGRPDYKEALGTVLERVKRVLSVISTYNWPRLPLKKIDIVALPNYHGVKPADNWGLIVFKESDLSTGGYIQLAQELLYQWLGALVTPQWWTEVHLNKAVVGFLAVEIAYKINDGCEMEGKWPMTVLYSLYYEYSKRYPHSRITGMKQETVCTKIELLLRMFNYTLGEKIFKKGLKMFMNHKEYDTFNRECFWGSLNLAAVDLDGSDIDVQAIAQSWIEKDRLPLITVKRNYKDRSAIISQKLYLRERPHDVPGADRMLWWIPIVVVRRDNLDFRSTIPIVWTNNQTYELFDMPSEENFIILNPEEIAPFPVNYEENNWSLIAEFLDSDERTKIPELTRAKLLHDAWNLAFAGELSFATALNMTLFLRSEDADVVWDPVFTMIDHLDRHIWDIRDKFNAYIRSLLSPLYEELMKNVDEHETSRRKNMRSLFKTFLCQAGYKPCIVEAQEQYSKWMKAQNPDEGNPVPDMYFCPVFQWGTQEEWEFGLQRIINFPHSRKQSERTYLLKTLAGCLKDKTKITRLLNLTLIEENGNFTEMDLFLINNMFSHSPQAYTTLFHFIEDNWAIIKEKYYNRTNLWSHLISTATTYFTTKSGLDLVTRLYVAHQGEFGPAEHIIEKSIRNIKEESKWTSQNVPVMEQWLDSYLYSNEIEFEPMQSA